MQEIEVRPLTEKQREAFLRLMGDDPNRSTREALRLAGYNAGARSLAVTKATVKALLTADPELYADMRRAQGRHLDPIEGRVYTIALDEKHPRALDAAKFLLERRHPDYVQAQKVEHEHTGRIEIEDRSASLDAVARVLEAVGAIKRRDPASGDVPAARPVLPATQDG